MNIKDLGGGDLADEVDGGEVHGRHRLCRSPKKIGITGGSYGGYMTLMAIGKTPDLWAAAVEEYGIINWRTMLQHEDPALQEYEKSLIGDPAKDAKVYTDDSADHLHPGRERRRCWCCRATTTSACPRRKRKQVVAILKAEGRTVDAHYYPNEGHGFAKRENQIDALERTIGWFDTYLKTAR